MTERRGSDQQRTPYKTITEVITIDTAYATGGWTLQSQQLSLLERATALQGIHAGTQLCDVCVPPDMQTGLLTGNTFKMQAYWPVGLSGVCKSEVMDGYEGFSGSQVTMLMEGR